MLKTDSTPTKTYTDLDNIFSDINIDEIGFRIQRIFDNFSNITGYDYLDSLGALNEEEVRQLMEEAVK